MTLRFVVVEDMGARVHDLKNLCRKMGASCGEPFAALADEDQLSRAPDIAEFGPEDLALVDAIFVDFDLQSHKVAGHLQWRPFKLRDGTEVRPNTGMSCLLIARDLMERPEYRRARSAHLQRQRTEHRQWLGPDGQTRLFSYVGADQDVSRLFAAAAQAWFSACYLNAQPDLSQPAELGDAVRQLKAAPMERLRLDQQARWYHDRGAGLLDDVLLRADFHGKGWAPIPSEQWPSNFDLYRIYLEHRGWTGFGSFADPRGFREAVYAVTGAVLPERRAPGDSTVRVFTAMQNALDSFRLEADLNATDWPAKWGGLGGPDPMYEYLQDSALFWLSPDVRIAFEQHRQRMAQPNSEGDR